MLNKISEDAVKEFKKILLSCMELNNSTKALFYLLDMDSGDFNLVAFYGYLHIDREFEKYEFDSAMLRMVFRKRKSFTVNELSAFPDLQKQYLKHNVYNALITPIYYDDRIIGFIEERNRASQKPFKDHCMKNSTRIAYQMLEIIKNIYSRQKEKVKKKDEAILRSYQYFLVKFGSFSRYLPKINQFFHNTASFLKKAIDYDALALNLNIHDRSIVLFFNKHPLSDKGKEDISSCIADFFPFLGSGDNISTHYYFEETGNEMMSGRPETYYTLNVIERNDVSAYFCGIRYSSQYFQGEDQVIMTQYGNILSDYILEILRDYHYSNTYIGLILNLLETSKSSNTFKAHALNTAKYARAIAEQLNDSPQFIDSVTVAAILHDMGILLIDPDMVDSKNILAQNDYEKVKKHVEVCNNFFQKIRLPDDIKSMIRSHHERPDGEGYPDHLGKGEIPLGAAVIAVAEAFEVMTAKGGYKERVSHEEALAEIIVQKGKQFDEKVVDVFEALIVKMKGKNGDKNSGKKQKSVS